MTALKVTELATANISIDKNDLLAIAVSRSELHIQEQLGTATREVKRLEKAIADGNKELASKVSGIAAKIAKPVVTKLETLRDQTESKVKIVTKHDSKDDTGTINIAISVATSDQWGGVTFCTLSGEYDDTAKALVTKIKSDGESLVTAKSTAVEWRRRLAQLPTLERQYRARLAEATLSKTKQGRGLLEALGGDFEKDVLALSVS